MSNFSPLMRFFLLFFLKTMCRETLSAQIPIVKQENIKVILQTGHSDVIECLTFSFDGKYIATGGNDGQIILWDAKTGMQLDWMKGHEDAVKAICFSLDGKYLYSASRDQKIFIWDIEKTEIVQRLEEHLWAVNAIDITSDGAILASGSSDETVILWDLKKTQVIQTLRGHNADIRDIDFSLDNNYLASCSGSFQKNDNSIRVWDMKSHEQIKKFTGSKSAMLSVAFNPKEPYIASCDDDGYIYVWNLNDNMLIKKFLAHDNRIMEIEFDKTGTLLLSCSVDGSVKVWDWQNENIKYSVTYPETNVLTARFSPDNKQIAIGSTDHSLRLWRLASSQRSKQLKYNNFQINSIDINKNENILISADIYGYVRIWDIKNMTLIRNFRAHSDYISKINFAPGDSSFLTVSHDETIKIWNLTDTLEKGTLKGHSQVVCNAKFSPEGDKIVSSSFEEIIIWDVKTFKELKKWKIRSGWIYGLCFSPDGAYIASGSWEDGIIAIWDSKTGNYIKSFTAQSGGITSLNFNPQGNLLVAGGGDNSAFWVWDIEKSALVFTSHEHTLDVQDVRFDNSGSKIVSASADHTVKIWDAYSYQKIATFEGHTNIVQAALFALKTQRVISAGGDSQIIIWDISTQSSIVSIFYSTGTDYVILTSNGYYTGSKKGVERVVFIKDGDGYFFEQFDLKFNRPDLVIQQMSPDLLIRRHTFYKAYLKRLQKMNFTENMLSSDFHVPEISLTNSNVPDITNDKTIRFNIQTTDTQHPLDRLNVFINDVPLYGTNGINLRPKNTRQHEQTLEIELSPGENKIQISVLNQAGAESLKETVYVTCTVPVRKPNLYLIGIGVGKFRNPSMNLTYPTKDIKDMARLFQKNTSATYDTIFVDTILDASLTPARLKTLKQKLQKTRVDDRVVLFVADHGIFDDSLDYYFAAYNTDFSNPKNHSITYEALENLLDGIPARQKLMLMDACHAGEIDKESAEKIKKDNTKSTPGLSTRAVGDGIAYKHIGLQNSFELMKELFVDLRRGTGATVIASAGSVESAMEGDLWNNSVFMYALLTGLQEKKADLNKDGAVMVSELQTYLGAEVEKLTEGNQRPTFRAENVSNDWRVW